ncbi:MAG: TIR domain-containing protein [Desulfobacterales bacterium]|nr:MAG: TIR domain-containing protein [Desulfobacterales bacterium]
MAGNRQANIFISHKEQDRFVASKLRDILKRYEDKDETELQFFLSEEIVGGEKWYDWIKNKLTESNLLLLLYTDPTKTWDWCLFEAGLFDRLDEVYHNRIVCLHSSATEPPAPLKNLQAFSAQHERIKTFLKQFFTEKEMLNLDRPIAKWLVHVPEKLDEMAEEISQLIDRTTSKTRYFCKYLFIRVSDPESLTPDKIPPTARAISSEKSLDVFNKDGDEDLTWGELEVKARQNEDCRWIDELAKSMCQVANKDIPDPIHAVFQSLQDEKAYRPIMYRADKLVDGSCEFKVLFLEDVTWGLKGVPKYVGSLLTALVMATRFQYEVINEYCGEDGKLVVRDNFEQTCQGIRQNILNIMSAAKSRGELNQETLIELFQEEKVREEIKDMLSRWNSIRGELFEKLDQIARATIEQYLVELAQYNKRFLVLGCHRFCQIMESERCGPVVQNTH